jgi:formyl-CoA transferase
MSRKALAGIRVLDLSRILAGPFATQVLGDLGAEIIKVEMPVIGDGTRAWGPPYVEGESAYYLCINRNKRSITVNLKSAEGRAIIRKMAKEVDIVIENFKADELDNMGLGYEVLRQDNPGMIFASISAYGPVGPYRERPGFDFIMQAQTGIMHITGPADGDPSRVGVAVVDITTGLYCANAILAALFARERHPQKLGQKVEVSLYECALAWLANVASNYLVSGKDAKRYGNAHPNVAPYQPFNTKDIPMALGVGTDNQFAKLCQVLNRPDLAEDARFKQNANRLIYRDQLVPVIQEMLLEKSADEWIEVLTAADVPAGPINTVARVFQDPHTTALEIVKEIEHPTIGKLKLVGSPIRMSETPPLVELPPPLLGQHTAEILQEFGYSPAEIEQLKREKIV